MQKICYQNANILSLQSGKLHFCDILVEDGKFVDFGKFNKLDCEKVDLNGGIVLPSFVNLFCHSENAFKKTYGEEKAQKLSKQDQKMAVKELMKLKNILAGAVIFNDVADCENKAEVIENFGDFDEKSLSNLSENLAKNKLRPFARAGLDLCELGTVDKMFKNPLSNVLEDFGILDRKPTIVGGNCFEKDELSLLKQYDCDFCLTPSEDGKFGRRPTNFVTLRHLGFDVGIGSGYSFEVDFFGFMRQILMNQRGLFEDKNCVTEQEVLHLATTCGAKILLGKSNEIEKGGDADFFVLENTISLYDDIFKTIVWEKSKKDVVLSVKNGEILQKNGKIVGKNLPSYDKIILTLNGAK